MKETTQALGYFRPPKQYFWRWAEKGEVIEWVDGVTICYREDIMGLIRELLPDGLPPFGALLLTLTACQTDWRTRTGAKDLLYGLVDIIGDLYGEQKRHELAIPVINATKVMGWIAGLDSEDRSGAGRVHLIRTLFQADGLNRIPSMQARVIVHEFDSGSLDPEVFGYGPEDVAQSMIRDTAGLDAAFRAIGSKDGLEMLVKTGQEKLPEPLEDEGLPPVEQEDLLVELEKYAETRVLAGLTRRIIAALNIPMHFRGSSDQSYGGVSDLTNRGDFDRLLLSELAHDDHTLMARLANNEALYLRREAPPENQEPERVLLVDATIRMWGIPRVFALAVALAYTRKVQTDRTVAAYALGGFSREELDLSNREGVLDALGELDPHLDCFPILKKMARDAGKQQFEYVLITGDHSFGKAEGIQQLAEVSSLLDYLIVVDREGGMQVFQYVAGRRKRIRKARFDLDAILNDKPVPSARRKGTQKTWQGALPAALQLQEFPLFFPTIGMALDKKRLYFDQDFGAVGVMNGRLVFWPWPYHGGKELYPDVGTGIFCLGLPANPQGNFWVLLNPADESGVLTLLTITRNINYGYDVQEKRITGEFGKVTTSVFLDERFYFSGENPPGQTGEIPTTFNWSLGTEKGRQNIRFNHARQFATSLATIQKERMAGNYYSAKRWVNTGYSVLTGSTTLMINKFRELCLGERALRPAEYGHLKWRDNTEGLEEAVLATREKGDSLSGDQNLEYIWYEWDEGSKAMLDNRGFLHLKSSNEALPEVTIVLIIGKGTACWASDGTFTGDQYFIPPIHRMKDPGNHPYRNMSVDEFLLRYLKPIIDVIC